MRQRVETAASVNGAKPSNNCVSTGAKRIVTPFAKGAKAVPMRLARCTATLGGKGTTIVASRFHVIPLSAQVWGLRLLAMGSIVFLCSLAGSGLPALAFALAWGPNGLFLLAFTRGALQLPRFLVPVRPIEPVIYRRLGVGLVKRIVATRMWPLMNGLEPPPKSKNRQELLERTELTTKGAEVCHGATFILVFFVALFCLAVGQYSEVLWIFAFNLLLNGYPVMLQRVNRWRVQQVRALAREESLTNGRASVY